MAPVHELRSDPGLATVLDRDNALLAFAATADR